MPIPKRRRGATLIDVMIAGVLTLVITAGLLTFVNFQATNWRDALSSTTTSQSSRRGILEMAATIRSARRVVIASSNATKITVQVPDYDGSGILVTPLQDGDVISYYLSNTTGSTSATGNILWRSVNGTADSAWSLVGGKGRILVATNGLSFTYNPSSDPESVVVSVTTTSNLKSRTSDLQTTQECVLRNKGL